MEDVTVTVAFGPGVEPPVTEEDFAKAEWHAVRAYEAKHGRRVTRVPAPVEVTDRGYPALQWTFPSEEPA